MTAITNFPKQLWMLILSAWHTLWGHPASNAREAHQEAVRALYRTQAEIAYNDRLAAYFDSQARAMDPHDDWHLFAELKDEWQTHVDESQLEQRRFTAATAKVDASYARLQQLGLA